MKKTRLILMLLVVVATASCKKSVSFGELSVNINYSVNDKPLITDSLCYHNEAGYEFLITEIQWFISRIELQDEHGEWVLSKQKVFYIDTDILESQTLQIASIPIGRYKALRFVFGLNEEDNQTGLFTNPPESEMFWPDVLGGGYHYMKLNGKFRNAEGRLAPLAIHLGIGQNEDFTEFYQNYFTVELPLNLTIKANTENQLILTMIIDNWFSNPNLYDFNEFGSAIMQNQAAQQALKENGQDVFTCQIIEKQNDIEMKKEEIVESLNRIMQKAAPIPHFWTWESVKERFENHKKDKA